MSDDKISAADRARAMALVSTKPVAMRLQTENDKLRAENNRLRTTNERLRDENRDLLTIGTELTAQNKKLEHENKKLVAEADRRKYGTVVRPVKINSEEPDEEAEQRLVKYQPRRGRLPAREDVPTSVLEMDDENGDENDDDAGDES